ncbi:hypothetical protein SDC9_69381 [bioreactor metagenome]|uniref:Uncharacterized protein n=1 Tax=bioreactor metagenome TaxID=1076179 RepID=A0A644Y4Q7_9ZZZZ
MRNMRIDGDIHAGFRHGVERASLLLVHRAAYELDVVFVPDVGDVAVLFRAEQRTRAANFQIAHGKLEPRAELRKFPNRHQPLGCFFVHNPPGLDGEVRVPDPAGTPHAASKLIQLSKPHLVRFDYDKRVDV